jgi:hypothetical protein
MSLDDMMLREEIAQQIEDGIESIFPPMDEVESAVYEALSWAAKVARGESNMFEHQVDFE